MPDWIINPVLMGGLELGQKFVSESITGCAHLTGVNRWIPDENYRMV